MHRSTRVENYVKAMVVTLRNNHATSKMSKTDSSSSSDSDESTETETYSEDDEKYSTSETIIKSNDDSSSEYDPELSSNSEKFSFDESSSDSPGMSKQRKKPTTVP